MARCVDCFVFFVRNGMILSIEEINILEGFYA